MGVIKRGILGGFSGKIGNVVGSSWKGIAVMKSLPLSVANPKTAGQVGQRTKFSAVVALGSLLLVSIVKPLWDRFAQLESGFNAFISENIDNFSIAGVPNFSFFIFSRGSLLPIEALVTEFSAISQDMTIDWANNSGTGNGLSTDEAYLVVGDVVNGDFYNIPILAVRSSLSTTIASPFVIVIGNPYWAYVQLRRADGSLVSTTTSVFSVAV